MNKQKHILILLLLFFTVLLSYSQDLSQFQELKKPAKLFRTQEALELKWTYSSKEIKRETNDSTYIKAELQYKGEEGLWVPLELEIRARGNFRRLNCYFTPLKLSIKKSKAKGTLFKGNKKLKLVLPCLTEKSKNDKLIKEYLAYKLYELFSPFHFKTRLVEIDFTEIRGKKTRDHQLMGFLVEDDKNVAGRFEGKVLDRSVHPLGQNDICSVQNDFFQFMIGNTDYSTTYQHNEKLLFINRKIMPVPYDFDMSGLVNASYSVVSQIQNQQLSITKVTQRLFRGFKRDEIIYQHVRQDLLDKQEKILAVVQETEPLFENPREYQSALKYINGFFDIISDDKKYKREILDIARIK